MPNLQSSLTLQTVAALCWREMIKFIRDRSRVIGALVQPLGFWLLLGLGFQGTFQMPSGVTGSVGYIEFLFPGIIALVILFTAIFSTISIVEERQSGFLQAALVAPAPRSALVMGNALGGTLLATVQAVLFLFAVPAVGLPVDLGGLAFVVAICFLTGLAFTAMGFSIAWRMDSTRGFHAIMNLFLLPLWFLSGALFPIEGASPLLRWLMWINPVSYGVSGIRHGLYGLQDAPAVLATPGICLLVTAAFAALMIGFAAYTVRQPLFKA
jgi:ABC-2 type transport system permease protein